MSNTTETPVPVTPDANRFMAEAQEQIERLRALAAEFPDESQTRPLTPAEMGVARRLTAAALEKAALVADAAAIGNGAEVRQLRDAAAYELAKGNVRDEAYVLARRIDMDILRRKYDAADLTMNTYYVAKGVVRFKRVPEALKLHVADLRRILTGNRRIKKPVQPGEEEPAEKK